MGCYLQRATCFGTGLVFLLHFDVLGLLLVQLASTCKRTFVQMAGLSSWCKIAIFSHCKLSKVSSVVHSQPIVPRPGTAICMALVPWKIWVACQAAGNWSQFSVREQWDHGVDCPVLGLKKTDNRQSKCFHLEEEKRLF